MPLTTISLSKPPTTNVAASISPFVAANPGGTTSVIPGTQSYIKLSFPSSVTFQSNTTLVDATTVPVATVPVTMVTKFGGQTSFVAKSSGQGTGISKPGGHIVTNSKISQQVVSAPPAATSPVVTQPVPSRPPVAVTAPPATQPARPPVANTPATTPVTPVSRSASGWSWPTEGTVISRFSSNGSLNKGIDIAGQLG